MTIYDPENEIHSKDLRTRKYVLRISRFSHFDFHSFLSNVSHIKFNRVYGEDVDALIKSTGKY